VARVAPTPLVASLALLSCVSGGARCALPAAQGRVVDRETQAPIAGALVVEEWRGGGPSDAPRVLHARFATTDAAGRFAFAAERAPSLGFALRGARGPHHAFVHADYGFVRGDEAGRAGELVLDASRGDAAAGAALAALCETAPTGAWQREIAKRACASRER
jgi:hypothetical protein